MSDAMTPLQLAEAVTSRPGETSSIGTGVVSAEVGAVELALDKQPQLLQFNGFFHWGVIAGLADHAAGGAVTTSLPPGRIAVTIDLHVNFLSPADGDKRQAKQPEKASVCGHFWRAAPECVCVQRRMPWVRAVLQLLGSAPSSRRAEAERAAAITRKLQRGSGT